jgi:hypothetical protein
MNTPRVIVCAAIRSYETQTIICGPRHGDCLNFAAEHKINKDQDAWECGFVDQENEFLTRAEAWKIADAMGQIRRPTGWESNFNEQRAPNVGDEGLLFSENLF